MAAVHSNSPLSAPNNPHLDLHQEGSSSGEWSSRGGSQPPDIVLPTAALYPLALLHATQTSSLTHDDPPIHDTNTVAPNTVSTDGHVSQPLEPSSDIVDQGQMHNVVRVSQVHKPVTVSTNKASNSSSPKSPSTVVPNIDEESTTRGASNPMALISSSGSDRGDTLTVQHIERQKLSLQEPIGPSRQNVPDLKHSSLISHSSSSMAADPSRGLKVREHSWGAAQHTITLRDVHEVNESPTDELVVEPKVSSVAPVKSPPENLTSPVSVSSEATIINTQSPTINPSNQPATSKTTTEEDHSQVVQGNGTDSAPLGHWVGNVTAFGGLLSNSSSVEEADTQRNSSEPSSSGNFLNRQVPATTQDPWTPNNSSGPTVDAPPSRMPICLSRMEIVWIVLAISVPVSSCCK